MKPPPEHLYTVEFLDEAFGSRTAAEQWWLDLNGALPWFKTPTSAIRELRRKLGAPGKPERWQVVRYDKSAALIREWSGR
jgi:hypothetical protein